MRRMRFGPMPFGGWVPFGHLFPAFFFLAWLLVFVVAALWIHRDAERRGMNGSFWVLALIFTNVVGGLFIYLALRDRFPPDRAA